MITQFLKTKFFRRLSNALPLVLFIALTGIFFWKFFLKGHVPIPFDFVVGTYFPWLDYKWGGYGAGVPVKNPLLADVPSLIYPLRIYAMDLLKNGTFPLWNDLQFAGYPLMANFQTSIFNPLNILFFVFKDSLAWSIEVILQPFFIMIFTYLFLTSVGLKRAASVLGSIIYAFSGFNTIWLTYNVHGYVAALIPLILYLVNKIILTQKSHFGVMFSLALCLQIFFGYPQLTLYTLILTGFWTLLVDYKKIPVVAFYGFLGLLLSSVQLLPGYELLKSSQRSIEGVSGGETVTFLQYSQIINLIIPDFYGNPATYNYWGLGNYTNFVGFTGVVATSLAIYSLLAKKSKTIVFFVITAVMSLMMALPNPISHFVLSSPVLGLGAATATRILVLLNLSVAVLAAHGFGYLEQSKNKFVFKLSIALVVICVGVYVGIYYCLDRMGGAEPLTKNLNISLRNLYFPIAISLVLYAVIGVWKYFKLNFLRYILLLLAVIELFRFGWKFTPFSDPTLEYPSTPIFEKLGSISQDKFRINEGDTVPISMWIPYGLENMSGYDAVYPLTTAKYIAVANTNNPKASAMGRYGSFDNPNSPLFDLANVKYLLALRRDNTASPDANGQISYKYRSEKLSEVFVDKSVTILENKNALPRIFFVADWQTILNEESVFEKLLDGNTNLANTIILSEDFNQFKPRPGPASYEISEVNYKSGKVKIKLKTSDSGFVFMSDTYYPGWKAYVDGVETKIYRANHTFRAIPVDTKGAGQKTFEILFIYQPESFKIGMSLSGVALLVLTILLIYGYKKNR